MKVKKIFDITEIHSMFEPLYHSGYSFNGENHNFWEFVYVIDGKVGVSADEKVYELKKNEIIFHKPMEFHKLWTPAGCSSHLFIGSFTADGKRLKKLENGVFSLNFKERDILLSLINFLREYFKYSSFDYWEFQKNEIEFYKSYYLEKDFPFILQPVVNYVELFLFSLISSELKYSKPVENKDTLLYHKIIKILENNVCSQLSIQEIADMCNISVSLVNKIFARYSSGGIHKYFLKLKIIKAIELLSDGIEISQISERLAFNNQNYFSLVFKRETGLSPLNYKKKHFLK